MNIIFIHQNFPGQFRHIAQFLKQQGHQIIAICQPYAPKLPNITSVVYTPNLTAGNPPHPYLSSVQQYVINGQAVVQCLLTLQKQGFKPDLIVAHTGWGEAIYIKQIYATVPVVGFFEFYYHTHGADVGFDPAEPVSLDEQLRIRTRNAIHLLSLDAVDYGITPTQWQRSVFPAEYQSKLHLLHEGVDTEQAVANPDAQLAITPTLTLSRRQRVVTYVARNLEPYRGFPQFMRIAEQLLQRNPDLHMIVVGGDAVSYGKRLANGMSYREKMLAELNIDLSRMHFLGQIAHSEYLKVLQISSCHVYLTVPFVLSWSLLEAMSAECIIVGSATPPVQEVIQSNVNGLLADFFDTEQFVDQIEQVLNNPESFSAMKQRARESVLQGYTRQKGINGYIDLFKSILNTQRQ